MSLKTVKKPLFYAICIALAVSGLAVLLYSCKADYSPSVETEVNWVKVI